MPDEQSLIEDLREMEKDFRDEGEYRKANVVDLFIIQSTHCKIERSKVKEILDKAETMDYYGLKDVIEDLQNLLGIKED